MKRVITSITAICCIICLFVNCASGPSKEERAKSIAIKEIVRPEYGYNIGNLSVDTVQIHKEFTRIILTFYGWQGAWMQIPGDSYIKVDDNIFKHNIFDAEGIELNKPQYPNEKGELHFALLFPPISEDSKRITYDEGIWPGGFRIENIDLETSNYTFKSAIPQEIQEEAAAEKHPEHLAPARWQLGKGTIKGKIYGLEAGSNFGIFVAPRNILNPRDKYTCMVEDDGTFEIDVEMESSHKAMFLSVNAFGSQNYFGVIVLEQGNPSELYIDWKSLSHNEIAARQGMPIKTTLFKGGMADINNTTFIGLGRQIILDHKYPDSLIQKEKLGYAEARDVLFKEFDRIFQRIDEAEMPTRAKEFLKADIAVRLCADIVSLASYVNAVTLSTSDFAFMRDEKYLPKEEYAMYSTEIDQVGWLNSIAQKIPTIPNECRNEEYSNYFKTAPIVADFVGDSILGDSDSYIKSIIYCTYVKNLFHNKDTVNIEILEGIKTLKDDFFREYMLDMIESVTKRRATDASEVRNRIKTAQNGSGEEILKTIIESHKGSVIAIDLWNTWCGPCLSAISQMEPSKHLWKKKGVVFVYLADESSGKEEWEKMIADIDGEHYRITRQQMHEIFETLKEQRQAFPRSAVINEDGDVVYTGHPLEMEEHFFATKSK
ncbi:MAG: redoxin family protein [Bacteroidales bacterium]|nr:redoxin family protein [Bacteroidales bacterium]